MTNDKSKSNVRYYISIVIHYTINQQSHNTHNNTVSFCSFIKQLKNKLKHNLITISRTSMTKNNDTKIIKASLCVTEQITQQILPNIIRQILYKLNNNKPFQFTLTTTFTLVDKQTLIIKTPKLLCKK